MKLEKNQTIEHVLPQGDNTLDEPYWQAHFPSREVWKEERSQPLRQSVLD